MQYQLLILRTHRQFAGRVWLGYVRAFREHAAASNLTDWSTINVQLFNFHAASGFPMSEKEGNKEAKRPSFNKPLGAVEFLDHICICK